MPDAEGVGTAKVVVPRLERLRDRRIEAVGVLHGPNHRSGPGDVVPIISAVVEDVDALHVAVEGVLRVEHVATRQRGQKQDQQHRAKHHRLQVSVM